MNLVTDDLFFGGSSRDQGLSNADALDGRNQLAQRRFNSLEALVIAELECGQDDGSGASGP
jgi:hypothetical protein